MYRTISVERRSRVIHDFPYGIAGRQCPHAGIVNITKSGHCVFSCTYCYARSYPWSAQDNVIEVYENTPELLDAELSAIRTCPPLYFCAVTDPFQPLDLVWKTSLDAMGIAANHGVYFTIVTKSDFVTKVLETGWADYERFRISITCESLNSQKLSAISDAPNVSRRLRAVQKLVSAGIDVSVRVDPIIAGLTDDRDELHELLQTLHSMGVSHITASTGSFNSRAFGRLLVGIEKGEYAESAALVRSRYVFDGKKFKLNLKDRSRLYADLASLCDQYGLGLSLCQEKSDTLPGGVNRCRTLGKLVVRDRLGHFIPVCGSDCLNACPRTGDPPCKNEKLQTDYPFKWGTLR